MTQPIEAVGGEDANANPTQVFEDMAEEWIGPQEEEETAEEADEPEEGEPEAEADEEAEVTEDDLEDEPEEPAIDLPRSWKAEEAEHWKTLPRATQEYIAKREDERERFVQTKAQEAANAQREAARQAAEYVKEMETYAAEQLSQYAQMLDVAEPDPSLVATNPALYAQQMQAYRAYAAQREQAQRQASEAQQRAQQYQAAIQQQEREEFHQQLSAELPEFFDEQSGPKLKAELTATAKAIGFTDEDIFNANARQIVALKRITDLKAKAERYDALMKKKMERVRAGKEKLPPVAKPGARLPGSQAKVARAEAAWEATKNSRGRDRDENFASYLKATGHL